MIDALLDRHEPGPARVEAITQRVYLDIDRGDEFLTRALGESGDDMVLRGRVLDLLGWLLGMYRGQLERGIELEPRGAGDRRAAAATRCSRCWPPARCRRSSLLAGRPAPGPDGAGPVARRGPRGAAARSLAADLPRPAVPVGRAGSPRRAERFEAMREAFGAAGSSSSGRTD